MVRLLAERSDTKSNVKLGGHQVPFFLVFGMIRPGIEPWSPGPLANTLLIRPMDQANDLVLIILFNINYLFTYN